METYRAYFGVDLTEAELSDEKLRSECLNAGANALRTISGVSNIKMIDGDCAVQFVIEEAALEKVRSIIRSSNAYMSIFLGTHTKNGFERP